MAREPAKETSDVTRALRFKMVKAEALKASTIQPSGDMVLAGTRDGGRGWRLLRATAISPRDRHPAVIAIGQASYGSGGKGAKAAFGQHDRRSERRAGEVLGGG